MTSEEHYEWETDSWKDKQNVIISIYYVFVLVSVSWYVLVESHIQRKPQKVVKMLPCHDVCEWQMEC